MQALLITNIGQLATPVPSGDGPLRGTEQAHVRTVPKAAIFARDDTIEACGPYDEVCRVAESAAHDVLHFDAGGRVAVPGFVDPHTHLVFDGDRVDEYDRRLRGASYIEILHAGGGILDTVRKTRAASAESLFESARRRARIMACSGTTVIEAKSGYGLDLETEIKILQVIRRLNEELPLEFVPTFMGAHALPPEFQNDPGAFIDFLVSEVLPQVAAARLAEFVDVFCETGVFTPELCRRILLKARQYGLGIKLHADELDDSGGAQLAASLNAVTADHLVKVSPEGIDHLAASGTIAVLLPTTSLFMGSRQPAPARDIISKAVPVAIATDMNPGTSPVFSMPLAMSLACSYLRMTPAEALTAATLNAAYAAGRGEVNGALVPGRNADVVLVDAEDYREITYYMGSNLIHAVFAGGRPIVKNACADF